MGDGGKGSRPRPFSVSQEEFGDRFDAIFGKKDKNPKEVPTEKSEDSDNQSAKKD